MLHITYSGRMMYGYISWQNSVQLMSSAPCVSLMSVLYYWADLKQLEL